MPKLVKPLIFLIEDDKSIAEVIEYNLNRHGYRVEVINDGIRGYKKVCCRLPDLVVLDWKLPSMSGLDLCYAMRTHTDTARIPVIMISSKGSDIDKLSAFDVSVDDYVVKPFSPAELCSRVRAVLQRARPAFFAKIMEFEGVVLDVTRRQVICEGTEIHLSPIEFQIMQLLLEQPTTIVSRRSFKDKIWGSDVYVEERTIDVHITRLRKALLKARPDGFDAIRTVRNIGYALREKQDPNQRIVGASA